MNILLLKTKNKNKNNKKKKNISLDTSETTRLDFPIDKKKGLTFWKRTKICTDVLILKKKEENNSKILSGPRYSMLMKQSHVTTVQGKQR